MSAGPNGLDVNDLNDLGDPGDFGDSGEVADLDAWIARRVRDLDSESTERAEDAQHALAHLGPRVLGPVIEALPGLSRFGQLCAIEIFTAVGDPSPGAALIELLVSDHETVREWAAESLEALRIEQAVPALQAAYAAFLRGGEPLDHSEGVRLRSALTTLGAREQILPPGAVALQDTASRFEYAWPVEHLGRVIGLLAESDQAVLYFLVWEKRADGSLGWHSGPQIEWNVDRDAPWSRIVTDCRDWAQLAASAIPARAELVACLEWIGFDDL